ncbi:MAG TPA: BON domain-containing protein [Candidatus Obscuribacterales bacterium]
MSRWLVILIAVTSLQACHARHADTAGDTNIQARAAVIQRTDPVAGAADIQASEALRRAIMADPSMSVDARNVFVSTQNGNMTLRGAVNDDTERGKIKQLAARLPEVKAITDELQVPMQDSELKADSPTGQGGGDVKTESESGR